MSDLPNSALLPAGFQDVLPPEAAHEAAVIEALIGCFAAHGYERVRPPLVEFEQTLFAGPGAGLTRQTFRLMDPVSDRMMGVRGDLTVQIARISATRLARAPRPLRLSYAGQVLRVKGTQLRPERQFAQVGAELIGVESAAADAEVLLLASEALQHVGVRDLSVDLAIPPLVPAVYDALGFDPANRERLRAALDRKDASAVAGFGGVAAELFGALLDATGPAERVLPQLDALALPQGAAAARIGLHEVIDLLRSAAPDLKLTVDPVENRGMEYHSGVAFTLFAPAVRGELGGGGRYRTATAAAAAGATDGEPATGVTLYMDSVMRAVPAPQAAPRLYLPFGTMPSDARRWRDEGWITVAGLAPEADVDAAARRLGCSHVADAGGPRELGRE